jgi:hypothetical protein
MGVAAMVAEYAPDPIEEIEPLAEVKPVEEVEPVKVAEPVIDTVPAVKETVVHSEEAPLPASDSEPVDEPDNKDVLEEEGTAHSEDWLNSHLSLLNKLN